ncbi:IS66 family transposase [Candidatus Bathyarchaeota archaeon]|nr:IS66 family transposase [Candidatus Bathyarchaeota archaeon]
MTYCKQCLEKQQKINELQEEIVQLKAKLRYQERTASEGFFGSSTPSSRIPIKPNNPAEHTRNRGGGKAGHKGYGRSSIEKQDADEVKTVKVENICPDCGCILEDKGSRTRTVMDCQPIKIKKLLYYLERKYCPRCQKVVAAKAPGVLPKCLYSNNLLTFVAVQHYIYGNTLGQIEKQTGIGYSSLVDALHQLAGILKDVPGTLIEDYRSAFVKHADETGWRTDGQNGYSWLFCTSQTSIYRFRRSRSASVAKEVFGDKPLPGVLVVDRYNGYNKMPSKIQYCYAHLLRDVKDMEKDFPDNPEIKAFVEALAPQLANAISLRTFDITDRQFKKQAAKIKDAIIEITSRQGRHPAIWKIQDIFREKRERLFHWADDRSVPADNNLAERELRPLVIARKISFGSQSVAGAATREILMTVLHTLKKRTPDVTTAFKSALDKLAEHTDLDLAMSLFNLNSS